MVDMPVLSVPVTGTREICWARAQHLSSVAGRADSQVLLGCTRGDSACSATQGRGTKPTSWQEDSRAVRVETVRLCSVHVRGLLWNLPVTRLGLADTDRAGVSLHSFPMCHCCAPRGLSLQSFTVCHCDPGVPAVSLGDPIKKTHSDSSSLSSGRSPGMLERLLTVTVRMSSGATTYLGMQQQVIHRCCPAPRPWGPAGHAHNALPRAHRMPKWAWPLTLPCAISPGAPEDNTAP